MNWQQLYSPLRTGSSARSASDPSAQGEAPKGDALLRTSFLRDYDRIIFSSAFRRLQNKTQVFPLPGPVFVHNRLTHSLEVASVGRSLGKAVGDAIADKHAGNGENFKEFYKYELPSVIAAGCLAHDIGNPPFGHSGEDAIRNFFRGLQGEAKDRFETLSQNQQRDFLFFEGNANAFRTLTHHFNEPSPGGFRLTYATLASIVKYPCESIAGGNKKKVHTKKYGFFDSEKETYRTIAEQLGIVKGQDDPMVYVRYPLVYLVEAADDICYNIIDLEDAHRLGILSHEKVLELMMAFFEGKEKQDVESTGASAQSVNDQIAYLRAKCIHVLIMACSDVFWSNRHEILNGTYNKSLTDDITGHIHTALKNIEEISYKKIYNYHTVVEIEVAGYQIIGGLLEEFVPAIINPGSHYNKKLLALIPGQFTPLGDSVYEKIQSVVDFISGMTDLYAIEMYRKIKGISIPTIK